MNPTKQRSWSSLFGLQRRVCVCTCVCVACTLMRCPVCWDCPLAAGKAAQSRALCFACGIFQFLQRPHNYCLGPSVAGALPRPWAACSGHKGQRLFLRGQRSVRPWWLLSPEAVRYGCLICALESSFPPCELRR